MTDTPAATMGRPRLYTDASEFAAKCDEYLAQQEARGKMPTLAGISLFLGFDDKESFTRYGSYEDEFCRTVKRVRMVIEDDRHQRLANPACTGTIFDLKVNHGWQDKTVSELTGADGGPIRTESKLDTSALTDEQLRALASISVK